MKKSLSWIFGIGMLLIFGVLFAVAERDNNYLNKNKTVNEITEKKGELIKEELIAELSKTKTIIVKNICGGSDLNGITLKRVITDSKVIKEIIEIIQKGTKVTGDVTYEGSCRDMELYAKDGSFIGIIKSFNERILFENDEYYSYYIDMKALNLIVENSDEEN